MTLTRTLPISITISHRSPHLADVVEHHVLETRAGAHHASKRAVLRDGHEKVERFRAQEAVRQGAERRGHVGIAHDARDVAVVLLPSAQKSRMI